uniref:hypothetical protein n=1 Tax=Plastoroseomonas arctica TaxID=1509237 RepID=UPI001BA5A8DC|nr:hypothetical protein [Plastoroseomonas arctica]
MDEPDDKKPSDEIMRAQERVPGGTRRVPEAAFDLWLRRGLHQLYDDVANEAIPPELLQLIEQDRRK